MNTENNSSPEQQIESLNLQQSIRKRPGMYLGDVYTLGALQAIKEIYDFADSHLNWNISEFKLLPDGKYKITFDKPFNFTKDDNKYKFLETISYRGDNLWGDFGLSINVMISEWIEVKSSNQALLFKKGIFIQSKELTENTNLEITFKFDASIIKASPTKNGIESFFNRYIHFHCKKTIQFSDKENSRLITFKSNGITDLLLNISSFTEIIHEPIYFKATDSKAELTIEVAFAFCNYQNRIIYSFVDEGRYIKGGTHIKGVSKGFDKAFDQIQTKNNLVGHLNFYNLIIIINLSYPNISWAGSIKDEINNPEFPALISKIVNKELLKKESEIVNVLDLIGIRNPNK